MVIRTAAIDRLLAIVAEQSIDTRRREWFASVGEAGWRPCTLISGAEEAERLHRPCPPGTPRGMLMRALPATVRRQILSTTGAVLMERITAG